MRRLERRGLGAEELVRAHRGLAQYENPAAQLLEPCADRAGRPEGERRLDRAERALSFAGGERLQCLLVERLRRLRAHVRRLGIHLVNAK